MTVALDPLAGWHPLLGDVRPAMSAVEALTFAQLGPHGIRVVGRRPDGIVRLWHDQGSLGASRQGVWHVWEQFHELIAGRSRR
jgi:hypothetical protein